MFTNNIALRKTNLLLFVIAIALSAITPGMASASASHAVLKDKKGNTSGNSNGNNNGNGNGNGNNGNGNGNGNGNNGNGNGNGNGNNGNGNGNNGNGNNGNGNGNGNTSQPLKLVKNGQARAVVMIRANANEQIQAAANELVEYVEKSTGAQLPIQSIGTGGVPTDVVRIYVGTSDPAFQQQITGLLQGLTGDGFVIVPKPNSLTILGPTDYGTKFGVYEFLERYVGVRWLMPGPDGEDVPHQSNLIVPQGEVRQEPVFMSRLMSPLNNSGPIPLQYEWAERNRMHGNIQFHHSLYSLFPPSKYGITHPEYYPKLNGQPHVPSSDADESWQPCFTAPGITEEAISTIIQYFTDHPEQTSYSLGMNDSGNFCEAQPDHPDYPNQLNSLGLVDMSDIYYKWVNDVVEGVLEVYPDKWFGLLAYLQIQDPPSFALHPRVVPFITKDRMSWIDETVEANDKALLAQWSLVAENTAWYDYMYGSPYMLPRVYSHVMAENYLFASQHGVVAQYAELYPNWGEGPKPWIAAKLQWNPNQDVDALLNDWYTRAVGAAAAPDLKAYYDHWEDFWTLRVKESAWFNDEKDKTYLGFNTPLYLNLVTAEEIAASRLLLESVVTKAVTAPQKARAGLLLQAFDYYEASYLSYPQQVDPPTTEQEALKLLDRLMNDEAYYKKRLELVDQSQTDPVLIHLFDPRKFDLTWSTLNHFAFWGLVDYMKAYEPEGGPIQDRVALLAEAEASSKQLSSTAQFLLKMIKSPASLSANPSFEIGTTEAPPWGFWIKSQGTMERTAGTAYTGNNSLKISHLDRGGPIQVLPVQPGLFTASVQYYTPAGTDPKGTIQFALYYQDAAGEQIGTWHGESTPLSATAGQWAAATMLNEIPEKINNKAVKNVLLLIIINNFTAGNELYLDDAEAYQLIEGWDFANTFWDKVDYIAQSQAGSALMHQRLITLAQSAEPSEDRDYAKLMVSILDGAPSYSLDSSFEASAAQSPWGIWVRTTGSIEQQTGTAHTGNASLFFDSLARGGPVQNFDVEPGAYAARVSYYAAPGMTSDGTVQLGLNLLDAQGQEIGTLRSVEKLVVSNPGSWSSINWVGAIPAEINHVAVKKVQFVVYGNNIGDGKSFYADDAVFYQVAQE